MGFASAIDELRAGGVPATVKHFASVLNAKWVDDALQETGTASVRRRKLPADAVVWLVIAMALFRDCAIRTVVNHLSLVLPSGRKARQHRARVVAASTTSKARERLGDKPMKAIFLRCGEAWAIPAAEEDRWRGLSVWALDGTTLRIPDTEANVEAFGRPGTGRSQSGYPQLRAVALMAVRSHLLRSAAFGPCKGKQTGEQTLAAQLWADVPEHSLVILDRNFVNFGLFYRLTHDDDGNPRPRHWLVRAKSSLKTKLVTALGPGDELVEVRTSTNARSKDPGLPKKQRIRVISYEIQGFGQRTLMTSLLDPDAFPAEEVAALYHERWETELGYKEIKTVMFERKEALRSKTPTGVRQEVWGIFLAYNLIRRKMLDVAERLELPPTRISFKNSLHVIRGFCQSYAWCAAPGTLPQGLEQLHDMLAVLVLPERRPKRRYPRHVKIKMSGYKRNCGKPASAKGSKS